MIGVMLGEELQPAGSLMNVACAKEVIISESVW